MECSGRVLISKVASDGTAVFTITYHNNLLIRRVLCLLTHYTMHESIIIEPNIQELFVKIPILQLLVYFP